MEAYAETYQTYKQTDGGKVATDSPDELAADCVEGFEVTSDMLGNYGGSPTRSTDNPSACRLCFTPRKLTTEITATIHIKGMNNIRFRHLHAGRRVGIRVPCHRQGFGTYDDATVRAG